VDIWPIGSTFKTMSTFALLQQMEQGKFKLDDPVNTHLTEFKIQGDLPSNPVTFRHLLTHTSGLPADFGPCPVWSDHAPLPLRQYLRWLSWPWTVWSEGSPPPADPRPPFHRE